LVMDWKPFLWRKLIFRHSLHNVTRPIWRYRIRQKYVKD
jgi:hypothetical protein